MSVPRPLSVLLVDDSALVCVRLRELLVGNPLVQVVAVAGSGAEALLHFHFHSPDLVVLDIGLPDTSGLTLLRIFKNQRSSCVVVMLTASAECREKAFALGADAFCDKTSEFEQAVEIIKRLASARAAESHRQPHESPGMPNHPTPCP
jgi:two-component system nitrate/nitrite response regulator NarL